MKKLTTQSRLAFAAFFAAILLIMVMDSGALITFNLMKEVVCYLLIGISAIFVWKVATGTYKV